MGIINIKAVDDEATAKALANAGMLYYCYGLTQNEIAKRMKVSRSTVSNYLRSAREQGIVDIRINGTAFKETTISRELRDAFGLTDVYVADETPGASAEDIDRQIAILAAMALRDILQPGDRLGIAWSELISLVSSEIPSIHRDDLCVYELMGGSGNYPPEPAEISAARMASRLPSELCSLRFPVIASSEQLASLLLAEPSVQSQLAELGGLDRYLLSAEPLAPGRDTGWNWLLNMPEAAAYRAAGAVALVCGQFLDSSGVAVAGPLDHRFIGADFDKIRGRKKGLLLAAGADRAEATAAVIRSDAVEYLFVDRTLGETLMKLL